MEMNSVAGCPQTTNRFLPSQRVENTLKLKIQQELERKAQLERLERKYQAGEISKFEYVVNKAAINIAYDGLLKPDYVRYSTTA